MPRNRSLEAGSTQRDLLAGTTRGGNALRDDPQHVANRARERWKQHDLEDVPAALKAYPELLDHRTIVIELAYEEYLQRQRAGEALDAREFADRFPGFETSLYLFLNVQSLLGDTQTLDDDAWPQVEDSLLGFTIVEELGRGAFARVYLASENALGNRLVVLKVAQHGGPEAKILGRLDHPHVVPVHSVQQDPDSGLTAVCMPYLGRATLTDVLDCGFAGRHTPRNAASAFRIVRSGADDKNVETPLLLSQSPGSYESEIVRLGIKLAEALAHSHQRGICHRDIKPSNVLMAFNGQPLLFDFNLSIDRQSWLERVGGTLPYMAPEDLAAVVADEATPMRADPRSDLFSLGVILYQLLSGRLPFDPGQPAPSVAQVASSMLDSRRKEPESLRQANRRVTAQLERVVFDCLAFDPNKRIQTAGELADRLRSYFRPIPRVRRWVRSHPWRVAVAAALIAVTLAGWGTYLAVRPPYAARMCAAGAEYFENGEYDAALDCLNEAVRLDRNSVEALMLRGRTYLALEEYDAAFTSFNAARKLSASPIANTAAGYCRARLGSHPEAVFFYRKAYDSGDRSVNLLNNMGYSLLTRNEISEAEPLLEQARESDPSSSVVFHNLLSVWLRQAVRDGEVPPRALQAAAGAGHYKEKSAWFCRDLAALYALAARSDDDFIDPALDWLEQAVERGIGHEAAANVAFSRLKELPEYKSLLDRATLQSGTSPPDYLIPPQW